MKVCINYLETLPLKNLNEIIKKNSCDVLIVTADFSLLKEQIFSLLFFDKLAKLNNKLTILFDIEKRLDLLRNIIIFEGKNYKIILPEVAKGGFLLRVGGCKIAFIIGDKIYQKDYKELLLKKGYNCIFHVDIYNEGYNNNDKNFEMQTKIISTSKRGDYVINN